MKDKAKMILLFLSRPKTERLFDPPLFPEIFLFLMQNCVIHFTFHCDFDMLATSFFRVEMIQAYARK